MPRISMFRLTLRGVCLMTIAAAVAIGQQPETPPAPGTPKDFRLPPKTTFTLERPMLDPMATVVVVEFDGQKIER